ncbi:flavodoxin [uncultured Phascolarctobacterium sp.]|jgi:flavodoxin|uniref:flavodoxin n=1 Tax=uncultured Phascolarctobacterium sp. TaxID=512296 RepID=UPI002607511E|nr:flavodoxin [uncultured Phascolarctobacterium sp.]
MKRREFLKTTGFSLMGMAALCLGCGSSTAAPVTANVTASNTEGANATMKTTKKILIAYFSWSGNTKAVAEEIHKQIGGELVEIVPETAYPTSYNATVDKGKQEQQANARPAVKTKIPDFAQYDIVFLGYPNWWGSYPMPVATFIESLDWQAKTVAPFFTHGGGGVQRCQSDLAKLLPNTSFAPYLALSGSSAKNASKDVAQWLSKMSL